MKYAIVFVLTSMSKYAYVCWLRIFAEIRSYLVVGDSQTLKFGNHCISNWVCDYEGASPQENEMLQHSFGGAVIFISLLHFIASALDSMPCLQYGH